MKSSSVKELLAAAPKQQEVLVNGWVKTFRSKRFIALNDGSTIKNIQCVVDFENLDEEILKQVNTGAALKITGILVESQGRGQTVEIQVKDIAVHGAADPDVYPIQPKKHSLEFLREKAHLRIRTNTFAAVMRVRSALSF
ncbi:MAG: asparagine--tRNA ligase, partial [Maribacter sp.]|nr:asparagine--tRNA ligase [Maribacter sp.]